MADSDIADVLDEISCGYVNGVFCLTNMNIPSTRVNRDTKTNHNGNIFCYTCIVCAFFFFSFLFLSVFF